MQKKISRKDFSAFHARVEELIPSCHKDITGVFGEAARRYAPFLPYEAVARTQEAYLWAVRQLRTSPDPSGLPPDSLPTFLVQYVESFPSPDERGNGGSAHYRRKSRESRRNYGRPNMYARCWASSATRK